MTRRILFMLFSAAVAAGLQAQKVSDVDFEQVGKQVRITYHLDHTTDIQVFLSTDGGRTFGQPLKAVTGDAGENITAGYKTVLWSPLDEMDRLVSDDIVFKVVPAMRAASEGRLPGKFSVSFTKQVQFSQGNLQYQASTGTWRFAEYQWDYAGVENNNISPSYNGWIDLFGWGTGNNPVKSDADNRDYSSFIDWGVNPISNGGNKANQWRTLSRDEWVYLFEKRYDAAGKYGAARVNGINGVVILPDEWILPFGCSFTAGMTSTGDWTEWNKAPNVYTAGQWLDMERAGAVFLPCAGDRYGTSLYNVSTDGDYWSSTADSSSNAFRTGFDSGNLGTGINHRNYGFAVRLVSKL